MKKFLKVIVWLFAPWYKVKKIEAKFALTLEIDFIDYEVNKEPQALEDLIKKVVFIEQCGINGSTKRIRQLIRLEWEKNKKGN